MKTSMLVAAVLAILVSACGAQPSDPAMVVVAFPSGNVDAGRQAFLDLKCTACHRVPSEPMFPAPVSTNPGPAIDRERLANRDLSYLATALISPSHALSQGTPAEVRAHLERTVSPMGDYSGVMTVRQLIDLHTYLRSFR